MAYLVLQPVVAYAVSLSSSHPRCLASGTSGTSLGIVLSTLRTLQHINVDLPGIGGLCLLQFSVDISKFSVSFSNLTLVNGDGWDSVIMF